MRLLRQEGEAELLLDGPSQEAAHTVLLPAGRHLQLFYRRAFPVAEQVEAGLLFGLCGYRFDMAARATAAFSGGCRFGGFALLLLSFAFNRGWRLVLSTAFAILASSTGSGLGIGWSSTWASALHARRSHHPKPRR